MAKASTTKSGDPWAAAARLVAWRLATWRLAACLALAMLPGTAWAQQGVRENAATDAALNAGSFGAIAFADLEKWNSSSGCSFAVYRGKDNIGLFDTQDPKKTAVFKIDGKLIFVAGHSDRTGYWIGTAAGHELRLIKGKVNPKFKNDGGSLGGQGRVEWTGPAGKGSIPVTWQEGC
jgi:hypothetical protein